MKDWFSAGLIWKKEGGALFLLLQDSRSIQPRFAHHASQTKFPGGGKKENDKDPLSTFSREVKEETDLQLIAEAEVTVIDEVIRGDYQKIFYLVNAESFNGELRMEPKLDGTDILSPPSFTPIAEVGRRLYVTHQGALVKTLQHFGLIR